MRSTRSELFPHSKISRPFFAQRTDKAVPHPPAPKIAVVPSFTFEGSVVLFRGEDEKHLSDGEQSRPLPGKWKNREGRDCSIAPGKAVHRRQPAMLRQPQSMQPRHIDLLGK